MSRAPRVVLVLAAAVLLGAWSGDGWRIGPGWLADLAGFQALWALGAFTAGLVAARSLLAGAAAGAAFGGLAISSYYLDMWLVQSAHSVTAQLTKSGGIFWCTAAVVGGAAMGALGAVAARRASRRRLDPASLAWAAIVFVLGAEVVLVQVFRSRFAADDALDVASAVLAVVALAVAGLGVRRTGGRAFLRAAAVVAVLLPVGVVMFVAVEQVFGYATI